MNSLTISPTHRASAILRPRQHYVQGAEIPKFVPDAGGRLSSAAGLGAKMRVITVFHP